jgi:hypothetical protein
MTSDSANDASSALSSRLAKQPLFADRADELARDATAIVEWLQNAPAGEAKTVMRTAFTDSIRIVYAMTAALAVVATLISLFVKHYDLDRALESEQTLLEAAEELKEKAGGGRHGTV